MTQPVPIASPLLAEVRQLIDAARQRVASAVNSELTQLYWHIGRRISAELLQGQRGEYGKQVVAELARQLTSDFGKGWSEPCLSGWHTRVRKSHFAGPYTGKARRVSRRSAGHGWSEKTPQRFV